MASRQLAQAWQAFTAAISRDASPLDVPHTAAQAVDAATAGTTTGPAAAVAAADADLSMSGRAVPEAGAAAKQIDPSDEADDEEVALACKPLLCVAVIFYYWVLAFRVHKCS